MSRSRRIDVRRILRPRALHGKLILVVLTSLGLALAIAGAGTYMWLRLYLVGRVDSQLTSTANFAQSYISQSLAAGQSVPSFESDPDTSGTGWASMAQAGLLPSYLEVRDAKDHSVVRITPGGMPPALPVDIASRLVAGHKAVFFDVHNAGADEHSGRFRVRVSRLRGYPGVLVLATSIDDVTKTTDGLGAIESVVWVLTFGAVGWVATRRIRSALCPLDRIADEAYAIGAGDLDRRVTPTDPDTEVGRLGIAVNTMLGRLETAFAERQASEERLRRFVADASHELRTPLTSIRGYAELFRRGAAERPEDLALAMARIESESVRMGDLVEELLLLARLDSGRPLEREPVDLVGLAHDAAADFYVAAPHWPLKLDAADSVMVLGDADRLRQVLANLLANVHRHTLPGTPARLSVRLEGGNPVIQVADSGPGLTAEQCARVFDRFYRADKSRVRSEDQTGGTGLGLAIVAAVAAAHGAEVSARPANGGGLVVTITFTAGPQLSHSPHASQPAVIDKES